MIIEIKQTCGACPSQWEGITDEGIPVYIRYRWGYLSVSLGPVGGDIWSAVDGEEIYGEQIGDDYDGVIDEDNAIYIANKALENLP